MLQTVNHVRTINGTNYTCDASNRSHVREPGRGREEGREGVKEEVVLDAVPE